MSTMGMYHIKWPAVMFGSKYQNKRPKIAQNLSSVCKSHYLAVVSCLRKTPVMQRSVCDHYLADMWDCVEKTKHQKKAITAARYRLSKFMRGRDSFGLII